MRRHVVRRLVCTGGSEKLWNGFGPELAVAISEATLNLPNRSVEHKHLRIIDCVFWPDDVLSIALAVVVWISKPTDVSAASSVSD